MSGETEQGAGLGRLFAVDEIVEGSSHGGDRGRGKRLAPGGGDDCEELEFGDGGAGDVDSLSIGASVGG